jgi:hypothetical protein
MNEQTRMLIIGQLYTSISNRLYEQRDNGSQVFNNGNLIQRMAREMAIKQADALIDEMRHQGVC